MDLADKKTIKELLKNFGLWAKRGLGQNFLIDRSAIDDLLKDVTKDDIVIEIGPGLGVLTRELCGKAKRVVAIEKDKKMVEVLKLTCKDLNNLEVVEGDALKINLKDFVDDMGYKVVSNLPFYISSPVFRFFLENKTRPRSMRFIVQKEIAEKVASSKGTLSILAVSVQMYAEAREGLEIKNISFWPIPKVDAAILEIDVLGSPRFEVESKKFFRIVKAGFGERRKKLLNSLSGGLGISRDQILTILEELGLKEDVRAERLTLEDWNQIYQKLRSVV